MRTALVRVTAVYRPTRDVHATLFREKTVPVLFLGDNKDSIGGARKGCFFEATESVGLPLARFDGSSIAEKREEYFIKIEGSRSDELEFNLVKRLKETFVAFNAAYSFSQLSANEVTAFEKAASEFEGAINRASDRFLKGQGEFVLEGQGSESSRLAIQIPHLSVRGSGALIFYTSLTASLLLENREKTKQPLSASSILTSYALMTRECARTMLQNKGCEATSKTVQEYLLEDVARKDDAFIINLYVKEGRAALHQSCRKLRNLVSGKLGLSTIDALLVRWAALESAKVLARLKDGKEVAKLAEETGVPGPELTAECWTDDDTRKLTGFAHRMNYEM